MDATSLLIVDDDEVFRHRLARAMRERGLEVREAASYAAGVVEAQRAEPPELAVVDLKMPGESGLVLVLTGYGSIATAVEAIKLGASNYLAKPADAEEILRALGEATVGAAAPDGGATPSLARAEWEHIQRVLTDCAGNISEAARRLGIHRRSLQRKLSKYPPGV
jgi:two-component system, response regulator RegA